MNINQNTNQRANRFTKSINYSGNNNAIPLRTNYVQARSQPMIVYQNQNFAKNIIYPSSNQNQNTQNANFTGEKCHIKDAPCCPLCAKKFQVNNFSMGMGRAQSVHPRISSSLVMNTAKNHSLNRSLNFFNGNLNTEPVYHIKKSSFLENVPTRARDTESIAIDGPVTTQNIHKAIHPTSNYHKPGLQTETTEELITGIENKYEINLDTQIVSNTMNEKTYTEDFSENRSDRTFSRDVSLELNKGPRNSYRKSEDNLKQNPRDLIKGNSLIIKIFESFP